MPHGAASGKLHHLDVSAIAPVLTPCNELQTEAERACGDVAPRSAIRFARRIEMQPRAVRDFAQRC
jgi:hypothetical protein